MRCDVMKTQPQSLHLFIAGLSGRALAQAAAQLGVACTVADCFGDADTRDYALAWHDIFDANSSGLQMSKAKLMRAFQSCAQTLEPGQQLVVITATGFESQLELLAALEDCADAAHARCAFNRAAVMKTVIDPEVFFAACDALHIAHPVTLTTPPQAAHDAAWLIKQRGGHGAAHVRNYTTHASHASLARAYEKPSEQAYYQQYINGCEHSLLAINNNLATVWLGLNGQCIEQTAEGSRRYRGAISQTMSNAMNDVKTLPDWASELMTRLRGLCERLNVRGLFSADVIVKDDVAYLLEINARPTATFELHDGARALLEHLKAFGITIFSETSSLSGMPKKSFAGHRYVFAKRDLIVSHALNAKLLTQGLKAPITDWPITGSRIEQGMPLCNLHAQGEAALQVKQTLDTLEHALLDVLDFSHQEAALALREAA